MTSFTHGGWHKGHSQPTVQRGRGYVCVLVREKVTVCVCLNPKPDSESHDTTLIQKLKGQRWRSVDGVMVRGRDGWIDVGESPSFTLRLINQFINQSLHYELMTCSQKWANVALGDMFIFTMMNKSNVSQSYIQYIVLMPLILKHTKWSLSQTTVPSCFREIQNIPCWEYAVQWCWPSPADGSAFALNPTNLTDDS